MTSTQATTVAEALAAQALLQIPPGMSEPEWRRHRAAHEPEMQRAYATLATVHAIEEAVITTNHAASAQYGTNLICNLDEEFMPTFAALADRFVADGARRHAVPEPEARPRLLQADITEMLPLALLSWYRCPPPSLASGRGPG